MSRFVPRLLLGALGRRGWMVLVAMLATLTLFAAAIALNWRAEREQLDDLSAVPFAMTASLPIAANARQADRSVLRLACIEGKRLVLVLRTKLAVGKNFYAAGAEDRAVIFVENRENRIETRMRLVKRAAYDTLVSNPLSGTALSALGGFFGAAAPEKMAVVTLETATSLTGQVGKGQISSFAADCR